MDNEAYILVVGIQFCLEARATSLQWTTIIETSLV